MDTPKCYCPPPWLWLCLVVVIQCATVEAEIPASKIKFDTGGLSRGSFRPGFVFGTATSAYQVEGMASKDGRGPSIWDAFANKPGIIANNGSAEVSVDQYHRYKEDVDLMANLNFDAYRFSISWSRIFPNGTGQVNWKGVAYYNRLIDYLLKRGITPYANLYHYDLPLALEMRYTGLLSRHVVKDFADYAEFCFKTFGDRMKNWMTFNDPRVIAALGYDNGFHAPGSLSPDKVLSYKASAEYRVEKKGRIGILLDFVWYENLKRSKADNYAAQRARDFHVEWFLHPIVYDAKNGVPVGPRAPSYWLYNMPWALYKALMNGIDDPGNVTLNQGLHDTTRINYYKGYLTQQNKAADDGVNVIGYFAWSLLDNFDWRLGYTSRFGITYVDLKTLKRYPKTSAYWFKQLITKKQ